ncbi:MAG: AlpA family phage regulatory protein [Sphingobacteriaceae bacterium]|nr:AlpA family phage regulatory protein [Sphingobacteriaceae bacterium]
MMRLSNSDHLGQQILFMNDIIRIIGKDRLTLRRWWLDGKFPEPVKLHGTTLAWRREVIEEWLNKKMGSQP